MKVKPVFTEKSMSMSKLGKFSFWVLPSMTKNQIKDLLEKAYNVKVKSVRTVTYKGGVKRTVRGKFVTSATKKKAIVELKSGKIGLFEQEKK